MEKHIVIGAGPAGLTAAWQLTKAGRSVLVLEADPDYVGGIARTIHYKGNRFDLGGHRFYSKSAVINSLWREMLPREFVEIKRRSRIYYRKKFYPYPLKPWATLRNLGPVTALKIAASYAHARLFPRRPEISFEDWIVNRFGERLFRTFFKDYTEKVWGVPGSLLSKEFVAQRIGGLSLYGALKKAIFPNKGRERVKTLITRFIYPRLGPGQLWESVSSQITARGGDVRLDKQVTRINYRDGNVVSVETRDGTVHEGTHFYSTMPLRDLINAFSPRVPAHVADAAGRLKYRDFLVVALIYGRAQIFLDNWIYIHDPDVHVGRIQNYKNWSADMIEDPSTTCLGLEYFCNVNDDMWNMNDNRLIEFGAAEIEKIGLVPADALMDGCVARVRDAYPLYDQDYQRHRETLKGWLNGNFKNLCPIGRGGLHNYNSQDHSTMAGILAVRNLCEGTDFDLWAINTEPEYAEEGEKDRFLEAYLKPPKRGGE